MILFRVDGNKIIGSGHVMRCLSIADAFRNVKQECCFAVADDAFVNIIEQRGYKAIILGTDYRKMDDEISYLKKYIDELHIDRIIVDSYYVTREYLIALKTLVHVTYIDDLASFAYPVDCITNYNVYSKELDYLGLYSGSNIEFPHLFFGLKYVPLRDEFKKTSCQKAPKQCKDVLISTGGADPLHLALEMVRYIKEKAAFEYRYHFLIGAMNQDKKEIEELVKGLENINLHINVTNMRELMCECDMAISAAGSTLYELCACGVPTITYVLADNQILGAKAFNAQGLMKSLGDIRICKNAPERLFEAVKQLDADWVGRKSMSRRMQELVDGYGADRLVDELLHV